MLEFGPTIFLCSMMLLLAASAAADARSVTPVVVLIARLGNATSDPKDDHYSYSNVMA